MVREKVGDWRCVASSMMCDIQNASAEGHSREEAYSEAKEDLAAVDAVITSASLLLKRYRWHAAVWSTTSL
jgi:hypothetical protein